MGFSGIGVWQLLILLLIVVMVFGTKRLRNMGGDLGAAIKGFRKGMEDGKEDPVAGPGCSPVRGRLRRPRYGCPGGGRPHP